MLAENRRASVAEELFLIRELLVWPESYLTGFLWKCTCFGHSRKCLTPCECKCSMYLHNKIQKHTRSPCCTSFPSSKGSFDGARVSQWKVIHCLHQFGRCLLRTLFEYEEVRTQIVAQIIFFFFLTLQLSEMAWRGEFYKIVLSRRSELIPQWKWGSSKTILRLALSTVPVDCQE